MHVSVFGWFSYFLIFVRSFFLLVYCRCFVRYFRSYEIQQKNENNRSAWIEREKWSYANKSLRAHIRAATVGEEKFKWVYFPFHLNASQSGCRIRLQFNYYCYLVFNINCYGLWVACGWWVYRMIISKHKHYEYYIPVQSMAIATIYITMMYLCFLLLFFFVCTCTYTFLKDINDKTDDMKSVRYNQLVHTIWLRIYVEF